MSYGNQNKFLQVYSSLDDYLYVFQFIFWFKLKEEKHEQLL